MAGHYWLFDIVIVRVGRANSRRPLSLDFGKTQVLGDLSKIARFGPRRSAIEADGWGGRRLGGAEQQFGVIMQQEDGTALLGAPVVTSSASDSAARHASKNAELDRARNMAWRSWRGRAGQAFELVESDVVGKATADSSLRTTTGHEQDDQAAQTKPRAGSCSRILDQSLASTRAC